MKFNAFKDYQGDGSVPSILKYLSMELSAALRELRTGLTRLSLTDNFEGYERTLIIEAGDEQAIANPFRSGIIPSKWLKVRTDEAGLSVCEGGTTWTEKTLYLKNTHATDTAHVTVIFLR